MHFLSVKLEHFALFFNYFLFIKGFKSLMNLLYFSIDIIRSKFSNEKSTLLEMYLLTYIDLHYLRNVLIIETTLNYTKYAFY